MHAKLVSSCRTSSEAQEEASRRRCRACVVQPNAIRTTIRLTDQDERSMNRDFLNHAIHFQSLQTHKLRNYKAFYVASCTPGPLF